MEFRSGELPDLYFIFVYLLFGQGTLDYVLGILKVPYMKISPESNETNRLALARMSKTVN